MLINKRLEEPYSKMPDDGPLPILSKTVIKSKLSSKFWEKTKYIYDPNAKKTPEEKKKEAEALEKRKVYLQSFMTKDAIERCKKYYI